MNSRIPRGSLWPNSKAYKAIEDFNEYLNVWEQTAKTKGYKCLSSNTCIGLKVTLRATLLIFTFLQNCGFQYLMTSRLNQDNLERFFGMMRGACGCNDHPDSTVFIQMFKLISTYSLIKPPIKGNISGGEMLSTLIQREDVVDTRTNHMKLDSSITKVLNSNLNNSLVVHSQKDHDYTAPDKSDYIISYMAGYVVKKSEDFTKCRDCLETLQGDSEENRIDSYLIQIRDLGSLKYPSLHLFSLLKQIEQLIMEHMSVEFITSEIFLNFVSRLADIKIPFVGCSGHYYDLTKCILKFYIISRMNFICDTINVLNSNKKVETKQLRKAAKFY